MKTIVLIVVTVALTLAGLSWWNSEPPIRYRLTVAVESGGRAYTGSAVIQIKMHFQEYWSPPALPHVTSDAVVIEVPGHPPIFALMRSQSIVDWDAQIPFDMFRDSFPKGSTLREHVRMLAQSRAKAEIPRDLYPLMVAFRDINRPASVYEVSPGNPSPPLDAGARVVGMTIEMTSDPVTYQVDEVLPWLDQMHGNLMGKRIVTTGQLADNLGPASFRKRGT